MLIALLQTFPTIIEGTWKLISANISGQPWILIALTWIFCIKYLSFLNKKRKKA